MKKIWGQIPHLALFLSLSHEKCRMLFSKGVVLGHIISQNGIEADPAKIKVMSNLSVPQN
jgi:hypothetical protein